MKKGLASWLDDYFEVLLISTLLVAITILSALQVVMRYTFTAFSWVEEVVVYFNVWIGFIGLGYAILRDNNLRVDLSNFLPAKISFVIKQSADFITFCAYVYLGYCGVASVKHAFYTGQLSPAAEIPVAYLYLALLVGCVLGTFRYLQRIYRLLTQNRHAQGE